MTKRTTDFAVTDKQPTMMVVTRTFNAPRTHVFAALTQPEQLARWHWAPGFEVTNGTLELQSPSASRPRPGGRGAYLELVPPGRLVYTLTYKARRGEPGASAAYLIDSETGQRHPRPSRGLDQPQPPDTEVQVNETLVEKDGATTLTSTMFFTSTAERSFFMESGGSAGIAFSMDNLARFLGSFSAPGPTA